MSLLLIGRPPKDQSREASDMLGSGQGTGGDEKKGLCIRQHISVASCDSPMARSRYRVAGISPMINQQNSPGTGGTDPAVKECG